MNAIKTFATWILLGGLLLSAGCVSSVHPLYTEPDVIFDETLLGTWKEGESSETWTFTRQGENAYAVLHAEASGKRGEFVAHLLAIDGRLFLDLYPAEADFAQSDAYRDRFVPTHTFVALSRTGEVVRVSYLDPDWLKKTLAESPAALRHEVVNEQLLITASPGEWQAFLRANRTTPGAFSEPSELHRMR